MREGVHDIQRSTLERLWHKHIAWYDWFLWLPLTPLAIIYASAMAVRAGFWRFLGMRRRIRKVRVISVGNLTVGGNGKTPFTLFIARALRKRGLAVGIVSRGYRGQKGGSEAVLVSDGRELKLGPADAGDEPVMMAKSFDGPIAIARRRSDGIKLLQRLGRLDAVVLDDAFQHISLRRDCDLVLVNYERGLGNGWSLPAGPMRERLGAVRRATAIALMSSSHGEECGLSERELEKIGRSKTVGAVLRTGGLVQSVNGRWHEYPLAPFNSRRIVAVSGLADPIGFYTMIRELDAELVGVLEYPDHYVYDNADWQEITRVARDADMIITTEKDLVKLEQFPFPKDFLYALRLEISLGSNEQRLVDAAMGIRGEPMPLASRA